MASLKPEDIEEFRKIWRKEFKEKLSTEGASVQAQRILELYTLLYSPTPEELEKRNHLADLTDNQRRALLFIEYCLGDEKHSPSVREVANAIGCRSSRTAFRVIQQLADLGLLSKRKGGELQIKH